MFEIKPTITVVIPTCERAQYLEHALRTCVSQDDCDFEILVSDNASEDNTRTVVERINDPRVKYVNPGKRLGMSSHWEFALQHVRSDYVIYIGDDDGLLPYSIRTMRELIQLTDTHAIRWRKHAYMWPDFPMIDRRNIMKIRFGSSVERKNAYQALQRLASGHLWYGNLPGVYHSCVKTSTLQKLSEYTNGKVFAHSHPDVWVCILLAGLLDTYLDVELPLSIPGTSAKSNGATTLYSNDGQAVFARFNEDSIRSSQDIIQTAITSSIDLLVLDMLHDALPILQKMKRIIRISDLNYMISAIKRARSGTMAMWGDCEKDIKERLDKKKSLWLNLQYIWHKNRISVISKTREIYGIHSDVLTIDASSFGIENIHDASIFCSKLQTVEREMTIKKVRNL